MPDYTTIAQRIAEARRRGCKVQKTVSGSVYDLDNLPLYDPDHDADCRSHGVSIVEPEPLWSLAGKTTHQVLNELPVGATWKRGSWNIVTARTVVEPGKHQYAGMASETTAYFDWPADDSINGLVILSLPDEVPVEEEPKAHCTCCLTQPCPCPIHAPPLPLVEEKTKTVADVLREMPIGQRFRTANYSFGFEKIGPDKFKPDDGGETWKAESFIYPRVFADDPDYGIILSPTAEPPPLAPCPKCGGECRVVGDDKSHVCCARLGCNYGNIGLGGSVVRLADHPVRPGRVTEIMAMFRELNERLGKLLEGKS